MAYKKFLLKFILTVVYFSIVFGVEFMFKYSEDYILPFTTTERKYVYIILFVYLIDENDVKRVVSALKERLSSGKSV